MLRSCLMGVPNLRALLVHPRFACTSSLSCFCWSSRAGSLTSVLGLSLLFRLCNAHSVLRRFFCHSPGRCFCVVWSVFALLSLHQVTRPARCISAPLFFPLRLLVLLVPCHYVWPRSRLCRRVPTLHRRLGAVHGPPPRAPLSPLSPRPRLCSRLCCAELPFCSLLLMPAGCAGACRFCSAPQAMPRSRSRNRFPCAWLLPFAHLNGPRHFFVRAVAAKSLQRISSSFTLRFLRVLLAAFRLALHPYLRLFFGVSSLHYHSSWLHSLRLGPCSHEGVLATASPS